MVRVRNPYSRHIEALMGEPYTDINDRVTGLYFLRIKKELAPVADMRRLGKDHWICLRRKTPELLRKTKKYTFFG